MIPAKKEHLIIYLWAVAITVAGLLAVYNLSVLSLTSWETVSCVAQPGFVCESPLLDVYGNLSLVLGQRLNTTLYNVGLSCTTNVSSYGLPDPQSAMVEISGNATNFGAATSQPASPEANPTRYTPLNISTNQSVVVTNLNCFRYNGKPYIRPRPTEGFSAYILINYTTNSSTSRGSWLTAEVARIASRT